MKRAAAALAMAAAAALCSAASLLPLAADQRAALLRHGPWPPPAAQDPGNPVAGSAAAIALGQRLFFDTRLSPDRTLACASCHLPSRAFADGRPRAQGSETLARNTPTLWNAVHQRWQGWDGGADSLWGQSLRALLAANEMAASPQQVQALVLQDAELRCRWQHSFSAVPADAEAVLVQAAQAIGAFVGSFTSGRTAFDEFRDALARGDDRAAARYPLAAQRGAQLFVGRGNCTLCHGGPLFTHGEFGDIGMPFFIAPGVVDPGRHAGIEALRASRYNLLGPFSSAREAPAALSTRHVEPQHRNFGEFKVPGLRGVALTAPYTHAGALATLPDVIRHYSELDLERLHADGERILQPLRLSPGEAADLLAFLQSLSPAAAMRWQPRPDPQARRCGPR